jgi:ubiquinone/menaquinone biosynthesis C-methylase UbiE
LSVRESYDAVAASYAEHIADELNGKPIDRALYALFAALTGPGTHVADVGCGPGHVGAYLAGLGLEVVGIDLSPGMISVAGRRFPDVRFRVGDMLATGGLGGDVFDGVVCPYSIVHFGADQRTAAFAELARVIRPGGWLMLAFHTTNESTENLTHRDEWFGHAVDLDFQFIDPDEAISQLSVAGFELRSRTDRDPSGTEVPTRRTYLIARRTPTPAPTPTPS